MVDPTVPAPIQHVEKTVSLPKECSELADALVAIAAAVKSAKANGSSLVGAAPLVIAQVSAPLLKALEGMSQMPEELKQDPSGVVKSLALAAADVWAALK